MASAVFQGDLPGARGRGPDLDEVTARGVLQSDAWHCPLAADASEVGDGFVVAARAVRSAADQVGLEPRVAGRSAVEAIRGVHGPVVDRERVAADGAGMGDGDRQAGLGAGAGGRAGTRGGSGGGGLGRAGAVTRGLGRTGRLDWGGRAASIGRGRDARPAGRSALSRSASAAASRGDRNVGGAVGDGDRVELRIGANWRTA